ncbi:MAG TPA: acyl-CoA thioesterase [Cytophagaceae bacterium]|jgi:acyl-CoA thioester hydrolase|nr:acyl-CoA thioesterase [Cytophagaceae bacterium]
MTQNNHLLKSICEIPIRFSEVDSMGIVWHGHYIQYFEDGREAFGREHGISYSRVREKGFMLPVVNISCDYKKSIKLGETAIVETIYHDSNAAKIEFEYKIYRSSDSALAATGKSTQVFLNTQGILQLLVPEFITDWKKNKNLL